MSKGTSPAKAAKFVGGKASKSGGAVSAGYGLKHQLRKGTEFQGMTPAESGLGGVMSDYAMSQAAKE